MRKKLLILVIALICVLNIAVYWSSHLYYQAKDKLEDSEKKVRVLEKAINFYPYNDLIYYELGKIYFNLGIENLTDVEVSKRYFQRSGQALIESVRLNPGSHKSHFYLAQSLQYMSYLSPSEDFDYFGEYRKSAILTSQNIQVFFEVGKIFLYRWSNLSLEDRDFVTDILKKSLQDRNKEKLLSIMQIWQMNVQDYSFMQKILPEDSDVYRYYAQFLGERSLSLEERQMILAKAEWMDFERAKTEYNLGQNEFQSFRMDQAFGHFKGCLNLIEKIHFYQEIALHKLIDLTEFNQIQKSAYLNLGKCLIEKKGNLEEAFRYIISYLNLEDNIGKAADLESYLKRKGLIKEDMDLKSDESDRFPFYLFLLFKQKKYREIIKTGERLLQSPLFISDASRNNYVRIFQLVGNAYKKINFIYEANECFQRALEISPHELESLFQLKASYESLNKGEKVQEIEKEIEKLLPPREIIFENPDIQKGQPRALSFPIYGEKIDLSLYFQKKRQEDRPLVSIFFNGKVIWENYLKESVLSFIESSLSGPNTLQIVPVSGMISLKKVIYSFY